MGRPFPDLFHAPARSNYGGGNARAGRSRSRNKLAGNPTTLYGVSGRAGRTSPGCVGAIYARYSSRFQHSIEDQVRTCREWAERNGVHVPEKYVFVDEGVTGRSSRREGLQNLRAALESEQIGVVIIFSTNRLYRKTYRSLAFVEEEIIDRGKRCVFWLRAWIPRKPAAGSKCCRCMR
ncbi:MAG: recombinase family protein [Pirellulales bacterium]|nr:recombinase family protein [Pirellulales bacterium]